MSDLTSAQAQAQTIPTDLSPALPTIQLSTPQTMATLQSTAKPESSLPSSSKTQKQESNKKDKLVLYCLCRQPWDDDDASFMIECNACHDWFHGVCVNVSESEASKFEYWNCPNCTLYHGPSQLVGGLRKRRKKIDFAALNEAPLDDTGGSDMMDVDYVSRLKARQKSNSFICDTTQCVLTMSSLNTTTSSPALGDSAPPTCFNSQYADAHGFDQPVLIPKVTPALGLEVPTKKSFSISDVAKLGGEYRVLTVIDVATQCTLEYSLKDWVEYLNTSKDQRKRVLNIISFEFSKTPLNALVTPPQFARHVDFVERHWPIHETDSRPRVSKYCLMGAEGSFTDFHVDFGGTSVWYHVFRGEKVFYFIRPTKTNLKIYAKWSTSGKQNEQFLGDLVSECYKVELLQGCTLMIPSGWIHAVYTPKDSLVFGGNFVHKHSLEMQLRIYNLERTMKVGKQYRFPNYESLMWYSASDFISCSLSEIKLQPLHVLRGYKVLACQLKKWFKTPRTHKAQFPTGMDVGNVVTSLESILHQLDLAPVKVKKTRLHIGLQLPIIKKKEGGKEKRKKIKVEGNNSNTEDIIWAQCDTCDEWRKVSRELHEGEAFCCHDVARKCRNKPKLWAQCSNCDEWHALFETSIKGDCFTCKDVNEKCVPSETKEASASINLLTATPCKILTS